MPISNQEFDLALLQLEELAALYSKDSAVVRMAQKFNLKRRALKKNWRLWCHRLFTKSTPKPTDRLKILVHVRGGIGFLAPPAFEVRAVAVLALPSKEPVIVYPPVIVLAYGSITNGVPVPVLVVPSAEAIPKIRNVLLYWSKLIPA